MKKENEFEIIISQVNWTGGDNKENRIGLTSAYFDNLYKDFKLGSFTESTRIIIKESNFRLPEDSNKPILLFATGTGVAPYIGFLQELEIKKKLGQNINKTIMYFGSKNKNYDFIYEDYLNNCDKENIIDKLYLAFSRDQEEKMYIQNAFVNNFNDNKSYYENDDCYIYVCGGVSMGQSLHSDLEKNLGKEFMLKLEKEQRYIKEFWGK
jgi:sulfite reductase alpha subunit-like flavoprotein